MFMSICVNMSIADRPSVKHDQMEWKMWLTDQSRDVRRQRYSLVFGQLHQAENKHIELETDNRGETVPGFGSVKEPNSIDVIK